MLPSAMVGEVLLANSQTGTPFSALATSRTPGADSVSDFEM
jgi:hypothetical protein